MTRDEMIEQAVELASAAVHEKWMATKRGQGVSSRCSESGEELMVPYDQLSEAAKDLDRGSVRATVRALADAGLLADPEQCRPVVLLRADDCDCGPPYADCPHGPEPVDALDLAVWLHAEQGVELAAVVDALHGLDYDLGDDATLGARVQELHESYLDMVKLNGRWVDEISQLKRNRDLALWLHAEAVWQKDVALWLLEEQRWLRQMERLQDAVNDMHQRIVLGAVPWTAAQPTEPGFTPPDPSGRITDGGPVQPFTSDDEAEAR